MPGPWKNRRSSTGACVWWLSERLELVDDDKFSSRPHLLQHTFTSRKFLADSSPQGRTPLSTHLTVVGPRTGDIAITLLKTPHVPPHPEEFSPLDRLAWLGFEIPRTTFEPKIRQKKLLLSWVRASSEMTSAVKSKIHLSNSWVAHQTATRSSPSMLINNVLHKPFAKK